MISRIRVVFHKSDNRKHPLIPQLVLLSGVRSAAEPGLSAVSAKVRGVFFPIEIYKVE